MRIDKWLWAARFFKTRSLAAKACDLGRIQWNGQTCKPAREIREGDKLHIKTPSGDFDVEILKLSEMRGPAATAQTLYLEPESSKLARAKAAEEKKLANDFDWPTGRPSKRDRRMIVQFRPGRF